MIIYSKHQIILYMFFNISDYSDLCFQILSCVKSELVLRKHLGRFQTATVTVIYDKEPRLEIQPFQGTKV